VHEADPLARFLVSEICADLALGCLNLCRVFEPQAIVLAGGVSSAGPRLATLVTDELRKVWWTLSEPPLVAIAAAGSQSGMVGAAAAVRHTLPG